MTWKSKKGLLGLLCWQMDDHVVDGFIIAEWPSNKESSKLFSFLSARKANKNEIHFCWR
jgi:hypothetical protein